MTQRQFEFVCNYCGVFHPYRGVQKHYDHIVARSAGGVDDDFNRIWVCSRCNLVKGSEDPELFLVRLSHERYWRYDDGYLKTLRDCKASGTVPTVWKHDLIPCSAKDLIPREMWIAGLVPLHRRIAAAKQAHNETVYGIEEIMQLIGNRG